MNLRHVLIALLVMAGVVTGMVEFQNDLFHGYGVSNPNNLTSYQVGGSVFSRLNDTIGRTIGTPVITGNSAFDAFYSFTAGAFNALVTLAGSANLYNNLVTDSINTLGLPWWLIVTVMGVLIIIIAFEILSVISKYKV